MHIIYVGRRGGALRSVHLDLRWFIALGLALLLLALAAGAGLATAFERHARTALDPQLALELSAQREEVEQVRNDAQRQLQAFSAHIAALQARLTRLDALGERLTELAELDASEFDFSLNVGLGGPEHPLEGDAYTPPPFMQVLDDLAWRLDSREAQLDVQALHRARERLVSERTALINQLRALPRGMAASHSRRLDHRATGPIDLREPVSDRPPLHLKLRIDVGKRHQYKGALRHPRMRNLQMLRINDPITEGQDVDVDGPRAPTLDTNPFHRPLDLETGSQQFLRLEKRLDRRTGIVEIGLVRLAPGRRAIETRNGGHATIRPLVETAQGFGHRRDGITDIAAKPKCRGLPAFSF